MIGKDSLEEQRAQVKGRGSVGCSDFCEPAIDLLLEGSDFLHRTLF
jgi:hypothetical protein